MMSNLGFKAIQFIPELREAEHPQRQPGLGPIGSALVFPVCWLETENTTNIFMTHCSHACHVFILIPSSTG